MGTRNYVALLLNWSIVKMSAVTRWVSLNKAMLLELKKKRKKKVFSVYILNSLYRVYVSSKTNKGISTILLSIFIFISSHIAITTFRTLNTYQVLCILCSPIPDLYLPSFRMLNCGAHQCQQVCHRGQCQPCPRSPSLVKTCPCAQTPLSKLLDLGCPERRSCSDPIPSCGKTCSKPLACGSSGKKE